jgi:error-prone DNA polymerase
MPDPQPSKREPQVRRVVPARAGAPHYAELHCLTNFSFLEGASHPDELVQRAAELGYAALAVTDRNSLAGVVRAHVAAKEAGLKLLVGAEITPVDALPVVLLATDRAAYARLSTLITLGRRRAEKGDCRLTLDDIAAHAEGLIACVILDFRFWIADCGLRTAQADKSKIQNPKSKITLYGDLFPDRCYLLASLHHGPDDARRLAELRQTAADARIPLAATNSVLYHVPERRFLCDVVTAIRHGCTVAELGQRIPPNAERHLKSPEQMAELFTACPEAIERTIEIAQRCSFSLDELRYEYPRELCPPGMTPIEYLRQLTWEGASQRYGRGHASPSLSTLHSPLSTPLPDKVRRLIEYELQLIAELRYEAYFLTVWDLVRFARGRDILCQGRGSAANSAVCYCLGVTSVDPERIDVLFERFVSRERNEAPDIDVDFEHERREEVIQYVYEKYGRDRAGMTAEVITYRPRSAVRDVGKALGLSLDRVDQLAKALDHLHDGEQLAKRFREAGFDPTSRLGRQLVVLTQDLLGFPRHLSQHVGGLVITERPLHELVPIENAAMPGRTVIEWDKDDLDAVGMLKVDCLALGMLTAIRKCLRLVEDFGFWIFDFGLKNKSKIQNPKSKIFTPIADLFSSIPPEDPAVYEMIQRADTIGVFQIESRAQMSMLPRLKPACYYDLVIEVAIVRPGPIQGDMVHPYLRRRRGEEKVEYPDERIRDVLQKTLGVPLFQEQAMRLAVVAAGFTPGEADQLRRAMGAWRKRGSVDVFRKKLVDGMTANGYSAEFADRVFKQIRGFGEYGFPESHAASFALLVYVSAWLKRYYPAAFAAALINSQPMGFYAPAQIVADARKHGVTVLPVDVNASEWDCTLERVESGESRVESEVAADEYPRTSVHDAPYAHRSTAVHRAIAMHAILHSQRIESQISDLRSQISLRLGFRLISGLSERDADQVIACRGAGPFTSQADFARRTGLSKPVLTRLARADAFRSLGLGRREALWETLPARETAPLFDAIEAREPVVIDDTLPCGSRLNEHTSRPSPLTPHPSPFLTPLTPVEEVAADYRSIGLSLRGHPFKFLREELHKLHIVPSARLAELPGGRRVKVAGLVLLRQRPSTAKGITFVTLEDETGQANLIVRQEVWERYRRAARRASALLATGELQNAESIIHVLVERLDDLSELLADVRAKSRDFR